MWRSQEHAGAARVSEAAIVEMNPPALPPPVVPGEAEKTSQLSLYKMPE